MGKFISAATLRELAKQDKNIVLTGDSVLTPSANDLVKELGLTITRGQRQIAGNGKALREDSLLFSPVERKAEVSGMPTEDELAKIVQRVIAETLSQAGRDLQVVHAKGEGLSIQPFERAPAGQKIGLTDVITGRNSNLCAGFMTFEHSELPWRLTYDEIDYVIEGDFVLRAGEQVFRAKAGDVVSIPNGTSVVFSSPTKAKVFYVTYPADWSDLC